MRKRKKFLLTVICLCIIGGALYKTIYEVRKHEKSVEAIKINEENIKNIEKEKARAKASLEKIVKIEEIIASKLKTEDKAEIKNQVNEKSQAKAQEHKSTSKERSKMVIVIDPGHASRTSLEKEQRAPGSSIMKIKEPGGAEGISTNTPEYVVNMEVAVRLRRLLEEKGYTVIMTKTEHKQMLGNIARAEVGNKAKADLVIRIHADSSDNSSIKGASMLVPANNEATGAIYKTSKKYGAIVLNNLINNIGMKNRGVVERNDMTGFNWSKVPVILVEMGFQSNVEEDKLLATGTYQDKLAKALAEGIDKALIE